MAIMTSGRAFLRNRWWMPCSNGSQSLQTLRMGPQKTSRLVCAVDGNNSAPAATATCHVYNDGRHPNFSETIEPRALLSPPHWDLKLFCYATATSYSKNSAIVSHNVVVRIAKRFFLVIIGYWFFQHRHRHRSRHPHSLSGMLADVCSGYRDLISDKRWIYGNYNAAAEHLPRQSLISKYFRREIRNLAQITQVFPTSLWPISLFPN